MREDAHTLYGFCDAEERAAFRQLIRISGIGARTALSVLSGLSVRRSRAGGRARRMSGRLSAGPGHRQEDRRAPAPRAQGQARRDRAEPRRAAAPRDVVNALVALGYSEKEAGAAVKDLAADMPVAEAIALRLKRSRAARPLRCAGATYVALGGPISAPTPLPCPTVCYCLGTLLRSNGMSHF